MFGLGGTQLVDEVHGRRRVEPSVLCSKDLVERLVETAGPPARAGLELPVLEQAHEAVQPVE